MMLSSELCGFSHLGVAGPVVKICGLMQPEHAVAAARSGADIIGLVFAPSRRQLSTGTAKSIRLALDNLHMRPLMAGVFVNEAPMRVMEIACEVGLDIVQLSGDETPENVGACAQYFPVIKAMRFASSTTSEQALEMFHTYKSLCLGARLRFLVDSYRPGEYGGTGQVADWPLATEIADSEQIILAGGLHPGNVAHALAAVAPWGVDVSSGVERNGAKDMELIERFVTAARLGASPSVYT